MEKLEYDPRNLLEKHTRGFETPEASTVTYFYDGDRERFGMLDGRDATWMTLYDGHGRVSKSLDPLGHATSTSYDDAHNVHEVKGLNSAEVLLAHTVHGYDPLNRPTKLTQKHWYLDSPVTDIVDELKYDPASNVNEITDPRQHASTRIYDNAERLKQETGPLGNVAVFHYDPLSSNVQRLEETEQSPSGPKQVTTEYGYDALDHPVRTEEPDGRIWKRQYDALGQLVRTEDPEGNATVYDYDGLNRLVLETRPEGIAITYIYDKNSRLKTYRDALGQETTYRYDALDRYTGVTYLDGKTETHEPDKNGNIFRITDARGNVILQHFDAANRMYARVVTLAPGIEGVTAQDPLGHLRRTEYDNHHNPMRHKALAAGEKLLAENEQDYDLLNRPTVRREWLWEVPEGESGPGDTRPPDVRALTETVRYDAASNVEEIEDALQRVTSLKIVGVSTELQFRRFQLLDSSVGADIICSEVLVSRGEGA